MCYLVLVFCFSKVKSPIKWLQVMKREIVKLNFHKIVSGYINFKFYEIRLRGYLVIANYMDFKSIQGL